LDGLQGGILDEYYHATADQIDILSRLDEDSAGLTFDGESIGSGGGSTTCAYGTVYINDITAAGVGNVGDKVYLSGSNNEVLISCSADDLSINVYVIAMIGPSNLRPTVTINGYSVGNWDFDAYETNNRVLFRGYATFTLVGETVTALHEDGATDSCIVTADTPPVISSALFVNGYSQYQGSQTELKQGDFFDLQVQTDIDFVRIEVADYEASGGQNFDFSATSDKTVKITIDDRGNTVSTNVARVRVRKASGTYSD